MPKEDGVVIREFDDGKVVETPTMQCRHCGQHWIMLPGSGRERGWCTKCMGPLCGKKECMDQCLPFEKRLDLYEAGKLLIL